MTGEVTLRGRVLAIGGLKEKTMAAKRNGITTVIIPKQNQRDLAEIDPVVRKSIRFVVADSIDTVLAEALSRSMPLEEKNVEDAVPAFIPFESGIKEITVRQ